MKTDDLIALLATGVTPVDRQVLAKRFSIALLLGALGASLGMELLFGLRPDLMLVVRTPLFWAKLALLLCLLLGALSMVTRLARPGRDTGRSGLLISVPLLAVWLASIYILVASPADVRLALVLGKTWRSCPFNIALLSVPVLIAVFWAVKGLAPTRLRLTGAAAGLLASTTATLAYCLHCPEMAIPFWGIWYVLGMLLPTLIGAVLGKRVLSW